MLSTISYSDFGDASELNLIGDTITTPDNRLRLTSAEKAQRGAAWHQDKHFVSVGFENTFQFQISNGSQGAAGGADGFAFVIQNDNDGVLGPGGGQLAYDGIGNSVAVEFDTAKGADEPSDSHISVQTRGRLRNSNSHMYSLGSFTTSGFKLDHGAVHTARIVYAPGTLTVYLDALLNPVLSVPIDLGTTLDLDMGQAYIGFTGATGGGFENHDILSWDFTNTVDVTTTISISDTSQVEGDGGNANAEFTVTRSGDLSGSVTLDWSTSPGTAIAGIDYTHSSQQITFGPNEETKSIHVSITGDSMEEDHESFNVNLALVNGMATLVDAVGQGRILNDDTTLTISDAVVTEGNTDFRFIDDFVLPDSGDLNEGRGLSYGPDGSLYVNSTMMSSVIRYNAESGAFIDRFAEHPGSDHAWYKHQIFGPDGNLYVSDNFANRVLRFNGQTGEFIDVFVAEQAGGLDVARSLLFGPDDNLYVASAGTDEILRFRGPFGGEPGSSMGAFVTNGSGGLDSPSGQTFGPDGAYYVASLATDSVLKYDATTGQFLEEFVPSGSGGLDRPTTGGLKFGPDRTDDGILDLYVTSTINTNSVTLFDGATGDFVETLIPPGLGDIDFPTGLLFDQDDNLLVMNHGNNSVKRYGVSSQAILTVTLSKPSAEPVTVGYDTADITTTAGSDYTAVSGTLVFEPGVTSRTIIIPTIDDADLEGPETFHVLLSNAVGANLQDNQAVVTILDNDAIVTDDIIGRVDSSGDWWVARSDGMSFTNDKWGSWLSDVTWEHIVQGDFNGDGQEDVAGRDAATGQWYVSTSSESGFDTQVWGAWSTNVPWQHVQVGDFNGDGKDDLLGQVSTNGDWWVAESSGSAFTNAKWGRWSIAVSWLDVKVADFDGDGRSDIAGRVSTSGDWWVARSTGTALANTKWGRWSPSVDWVNVATGDFNGDGSMDLVGQVSTSGDWWVAASTGSAFTNGKWGRWSANASWVDVNIGDFNGDGRDDLIGRVGTSGDWWVTESTGTAFSNAKWGRWSPAAAWIDVQVGDFNGDGRSDLAGRVASSGDWWVARSEGDSLINEKWGRWSTAVDWMDVRVGNADGFTAAGGSMGAAAADAYWREIGRNRDEDDGDERDLMANDLADELFLE